jgi:hypothetical protein
VPNIRKVKSRTWATLSKRSGRTLPAFGFLTLIDD